MKTSKQNLDFWVKTNSKRLTLGEFHAATGMQFHDFSHTYKTATRRAWQEYLTSKEDVVSGLEANTKQREAYLLRIIEVWKQRYYKARGLPS